MNRPLRVLALNPFHTGSHRTFLTEWIQASRHDFTVLARPGHHWKWRMREAPVTLADAVHQRRRENWDVLFTTDMLNLAEFRGLCPRASCLPSVVYFHENQLTYPQSENIDAAAKQRDMHFAFSNFVTALAAEQVWFNSEFHRQEFLAALPGWLTRMPDGDLQTRILSLADKSCVMYPGIHSANAVTKPSAPRNPAPLRIAWVSRWEHDKAPHVFFDAMRMLRARDCAFRLTVLGESYARVPECFAQAKHEFADVTDHWGFVKARSAYEAALRMCDVVVSTARHEFFGLAVVEAVSNGCVPFVPQGLAYPEVLDCSGTVFHRNSPADIADKLASFASNPHGPDHLRVLQQLVRKYDWSIRAAAMDEALDQLLKNTGSGTTQLARLDSPDV